MLFVLSFVGRAPCVGTVVYNSEWMSLHNSNSRLSGNLFFVTGIINVPIAFFASVVHVSQ